MYAANLIQRLSRDHRVDLVSLVFPEDESYLAWPQDHCSTVHAIHADRTTIVRRLLNLGSAYLYGRQLHYRHSVEELLHWGRQLRRWDVLHVEGGFMAGLIPAGYSLPKVLSLHDSEMLRAEEMLRCPLDWRTRLNYLVRRYYEPRYARQVYPRFDRCVLVAERDAHFNRQVVPQGRFVVISSGIDTEYYHPFVMHRKSPTIVFHGSLNYPPNVDAALHLANEILPLVQRRIPQVSLKLAGARPETRIRALAAYPAITLAADLPDLRAALASGDVYACAVRYGSGLKTKLLEAMAMGLPIVCYRSSTSGLDCVPGKHLQVADGAIEFASRIIDLVQHPLVGREMAKAARDLVVEKYSWESKANLWSSLYQEVVNLQRISRGADFAKVRVPEAATTIES